MIIENDIIDKNRGNNMRLTECKLHVEYRIVTIESEDENFLNRLLSFGIAKGSIITPLHYSAKKSTLAISIQQSQIALRDCEAKQIIIQPIQ